MNERQYKFKIKKQEDQIRELYVLIDTLQANLRSAVSEINPTKREVVTKVPSFKYCLNWRAGDEA